MMEKFVYELAELFHDVDPYDFLDNFDNNDDAAEEFTRMIVCGEYMALKEIIFDVLEDIDDEEYQVRGEILIDDLEKIAA